MGGWTIIHDGEWYTLPFDFDFPRSVQKSNQPDAVAVIVDERDFDGCWATTRLGLPAKGRIWSSLIAASSRSPVTRRSREQSGLSNVLIAPGAAAIAGVHLIGFSDPENGKAAEREAVVSII